MIKCNFYKEVLHRLILDLETEIGKRLTLDYMHESFGLSIDELKDLDYWDDDYIDEMIMKKI